MTYNELLLGGTIQKRGLIMYTPCEAATVFRSIRKMLFNKPELFTKEGLFRISGDRGNAKALIRHILDPIAVIKAPPSLNELSVYDAISALKLMLDAQESAIMDPRNSRLAQLKEILENEDIARCVQAVHGYIHELCISANSDEHCQGEVLYTLMQLAKETVRHEQRNRMNSENVGIVLGPNFEKLINDDPTKMLLFTNKLNMVCKMMLEDETYSLNFEPKYASYILQARKQQITECLAMKKLLIKQKALYQDKMSGFQGKVVRKKSILQNASRKGKKNLLTQVKDDESAIASYMKVAPECLDAQISQMEAEISALKQKYPDQQTLQWNRISELLEDIDEYITDSDEGFTKHFTVRRSFDGLIPMDISNDDSEKGDKDMLRKSRNPLMSPFSLKSKL
jgi:hypothetical protein